VVTLCRNASEGDQKVIGTVLKVKEEVFCTQGAMQLYHQVSGTSTSTTQRRWMAMHPPLTLPATARRVDCGCIQADSYDQSQEAHHNSE
jgi:hypothetical protein